MMPSHQYIRRDSGEVMTEHLLADRWIGFLYSDMRERFPHLFKALTSNRACDLLGRINYEGLQATNPRKTFELINAWGLDVSEFLDEPETVDTPYKLFTRKIRYWQCRPMTAEQGAVVSPADARLLVGSFARENLLFLKNKFFSYQELLGRGKRRWLSAFAEGDCAIFRLTPDKYHYVHTPVAGRVVDIYEIEGAYHSCNPGAVVSLAQPFSKNKRVVTIIDTDCPEGTGVGLVAHIEIVALMVGDIEQRYSQSRYERPEEVIPGLKLAKGRPKSLFKPGSSTVVLIFQPQRISFAQDIVDNQCSLEATSRYSLGFGAPLVETDLKVRETIAHAKRH